MLNGCTDSWMGCWTGCLMGGCWTDHWTGCWRISGGIAQWFAGGVKSWVAVKKGFVFYDMIQYEKLDGFV